jgi:hypothetical protein
MMGQRELGEPKDRNELAVIVIDSEKWNRRWSISSRKIPDPYGCGGLPLFLLLLCITLYE